MTICRGRHAQRSGEPHRKDYAHRWKMCTLDHYLKDDDDRPVCMELNDETWETDFL